MGKRSVMIANLDVEKLPEMLNAALAEEWLAYTSTGSVPA